MCWACVAQLSDHQEARIVYGGHGFLKQKSNLIKMSNLYKEPSKYAFYQVSIHLAKRFHRRSFLEIDQPGTRITNIGLAS